MKSQYWSIDRLPGLRLPEQKLLKSEDIEDTQELLKRTKTLELKQRLATHRSLI